MKTPEERLAAVRELSERAMTRPAPKRLRLATTAEAEAERAPRPSPTAVEDFQALPTLGPIGRASGQKARRPREVQSDAERWRGETFSGTKAGELGAEEFLLGNQEQRKP